jgi:(E)-4-hydroxy-3-methylbut-2-enyl-diphosphate synthase
MAETFEGADSPALRGVTAMVSALQHCQMLDDLGFPLRGLAQGQRPAQGDRRERATLPASAPRRASHLGVTEAPSCRTASSRRIAFEQLLSRGIGDTIRVSLTLPFADKWKEVEAGREIIKDIEEGRFRSVEVPDHSG